MQLSGGAVDALHKLRLLRVIGLVFGRHENAIAKARDVRRVVDAEKSHQEFLFTIFQLIVIFDVYNRARRCFFVVAQKLL